MKTHSSLSVDHSPVMDIAAAPGEPIGFLSAADCAVPVDGESARIPFEDPAHPWRLTVIAPGSGKTTLLKQWAAQSLRRFAWIALDEVGPPPHWFSQYLRDALAAAAEPQMREPLAEALSADQLTGDVHRLAQSFSRAFDLFEDGVVVVVDDYHLVADSSVHLLVSLLIARASPNVRFVISSRRQPPLPLARMRGRGILREIGAADLRFTYEEAARFLTASLGPALDEDQVRTLYERTEGWAAGLRLAALIVGRAEDRNAAVESFSGKSRYIADYLAAEALDNQPADMQSFLQRSSIFPTFSAALCDDVLQIDNSRLLVDAACASGLFIEALDDNREWFRYHGLFRGQLQSILSEQGAAPVRDLHRRASAWFAAGGMRTEAVRHAIGADDWDLVADLIRPAAMPLILTFPAIRKWLLSIDAETIGRKPLLGVWAAWTAIVTGDYRKYIRLCELAEPAIERAGDTFARALLLTTHASDQYHRGDGAAGLRSAEEALALLPSDAMMERAIATANAGGCLMIMGRVVEAEKRIRDALAQAGDEDLTIAYRLVAMSNLGRTLTLAGRLDEAARQLTKTANLSNSFGACGSPRTHVFLADLHLLHHDLDAAELEITRAVHAFKISGFGATKPLSQLIVARIQWARGQYASCLDVLQELISWAELNQTILFARRAAAYRARVWTRMGRPERAADWFYENIAKAGLAPAYELQEAYLAHFDTIAAMSVGRTTPSGELARALEAADRLASFAEADGRGTDMLRLRAARAVLLAAGGQTEQALGLLGRLLSDAAGERQVWVFLEAGAPMRRLLESAPVQAAAGVFAADIRAAFGIGVKPAASWPRAEYPIDEVTQREGEVLSLLSAGLTNQEIASTLYVSENTVKTHIKHIFAKLNVRNRTEALNRGRVLGLC